MIQNRLAYLNALGSEPWSRDNNCWSVVRQIRRDLFGCDGIPPVNADLIKHPERRQEAFRSGYAEAGWHPVDTPKDGDLVVMTKPHDFHVGIYLVCGGRGLVWHSDLGHDLVSETILEVTHLRRWKLSFYRYRT